MRQRLPLLHAAVAVLLGGPHALEGLDAGADVAGLVAGVVAPREAAVIGVLAAVDDELEVAHCGVVVWVVERGREDEMCVV